MILRIQVSLKEVSNHPSIKAIKRRNLLKLLQNVWVPFCGGKIQEEKELYQQKRKTNISGCENIFANLAITPDGSIYACCGLAVLNIPELRLGNIYEQNLPEILNSGFEDPLKAWLRIDGPEIIIQKLRDNGHSIINSASTPIFSDPRTYGVPH